LRVRFQKPIASLRMQYSATQQPHATAKHSSSFAVSRQTSDGTLPTFKYTREGQVWAQSCGSQQ
jgi:hypothetical protein